MPINRWGLLALIAFGLWLMYWMHTDADGYLTILDDINLVIHEFGHPFFSIFGEEPQWWGGTWMELIVPAVCAGVFWYQRSALSFGFAAVWFFENFHYIARYVADARVQELPLAGGGEHDWAWILGRHGWLQKDAAIADTLYKIGYVGIVATLIFCVFIWLDQRGRAAEAPPRTVPPQATPPGTGQPDPSRAPPSPYG
jgi:hypothetical protein